MIGTDYTAFLRPDATPERQRAMQLRDMVARRDPRRAQGATDAAVMAVGDILQAVLARGAEKKADLRDDEARKAMAAALKGYTQGVVDERPTEGFVGPMNAAIGAAGAEKAVQGMPGAQDAQGLIAALQMQDYGHKRAAETAMSQREMELQDWLAKQKFTGGMADQRQQQQMAAQQQEAERQRQFQAEQAALNRDVQRERNAAMQAQRDAQQAAKEQQREIENREVVPDYTMAEQLGFTKSEADRMRGPYAKLSPSDQGRLAVELQKKHQTDMEKAAATNDQARAVINDLDRYEQLMKGQETGGVMLNTPLIGGAMRTFDPQLSEMKSIEDRNAPLMRQGLPGAASDRDVSMFKSGLPSTERKPEANRNIIAGQRARFDNNIARNEFMDSYFNTFGHTNGANEMWQRYLEANPIFSPDATQEDFTLNPARVGWRDWMAAGRPTQEMIMRTYEAQNEQPQQNNRGWVRVGD